MNEVKEIRAVVSRMIELLVLGNRTGWANALEQHLSEIEVNPNAAEASMLAMFGGMGSLNDVILYSDEQPLLDENNEFNELRSRLYMLCHKDAERRG